LLLRSIEGKRFYGLICTPITLYFV